MDLCHDCQEFAVLLCKKLHHKMPFDCESHSAPLDELPEKAKYCRLCHLVDYHAAKALDNPSWSLNKNAEVTKVVRQADVWNIYAGYLKGPVSEISISVKPPHSDLVLLRGAIWASPGSCSQCQSLSLLVLML